MSPVNGNPSFRNRRAIERGINSRGYFWGPRLTARGSYRSCRLCSEQSAKWDWVKGTLYEDHRVTAAYGKMGRGAGAEGLFQQFKESMEKPKRGQAGQATFPTGKVACPFSAPVVRARSRCPVGGASPGLPTRCWMRRKTARFTPSSRSASAPRYTTSPPTPHPTPPAPAPAAHTA